MTSSEIRLLIACMLLLFVGSTMLLSRVRWFSRTPLHVRIQPFHTLVLGSRALPFQRTISHDLARNLTLRDTDTLHAVMEFLTELAESVVRALGVTTDTQLRLVRAGSNESVSSFRFRQAMYSLGTFFGFILCAKVAGVPTLFTFCVACGVLMLVFLCMEQRLSQRAAARQQRLFYELPIIAEQIATLLGAGLSVGAALARCAERNTGISGSALRTIEKQTQHGMSLASALQEWEREAGLPQLKEFTAILSLQEAPNMAVLMDEYAHNIRAAAHRQRSELIEQRAQQVWIPVTVATLLPGIIFLLIPFLQALRLLTNS